MAFGLVLSAGLLHALWNLAAKHAGAGIAFSFVATAIGVVVWAPVGVTVLLKDAQHYGTRQWSLIAASAMLHVLYFAVLLRGYQVGDLSVVYPVARGSGPLITVVAAVLVLGESPGILGVTGVICIVGGVLMIARGNASQSTTASRATLLAGVKYGLATGLFIAAYSVLDGYSVKRSGVSPISLDYGSNLFRVVATGAIVAIIAARNTEFSLQNLVRDNWRDALVVGALSPAAYILVLQAVRIAPLSKVAPAREVSMLFAAIFAGRFLREGDTRRRISGAALIAVGVVAIAAS